MGAPQVRDVEAAIAAILAVRNCPASQKLCLDVYSLSQRGGESAALAVGAAVLSGVREYERCERELERLRDSATAGVVLGEKPLPIGGEWWGLLADGDVVPARDKRSGGAAYWCVDGSGWWRVAQAGRAAA